MIIRDIHKENKMYPDPNNVQPQQPVQQPQPMPAQPAQYQPQPVVMAPQSQPVPYPNQPQPTPVQPQQQYYTQPAQQPTPGYAPQPQTQQQHATYSQVAPVAVSGMGIDVIIGLASVVVGGLALVLSWIPIAGIIIGVIAVGLGVTGIIMIRKKGGKLWSAISGASAGGLALIVAITIMAIGGVDYAEYNRLCQEEKNGVFSRSEGSAKVKVTVTCKNGAVDQVDRD